jgi:o-succinylbenzoate synthase
MISMRTIHFPLHFKRPAGTSRGVLHQKDSWFIVLEENGKKGIGECSLISGLSPDNKETYEKELDWLCTHTNSCDSWMETKGPLFPSIKFGMETALADLNSGGKNIFGETDFTRGTKGIPINGLIWMGSPEFMRQQIREKLDAGFNCIKIKIGAIDFEEELALLKMIRQQFDANAIEIRLDANGAFATEEALEKLKRLSAFNIHSIEQPIQAGQWEKMAGLCEKSPIPIALDEELIGLTCIMEQQKMLETIKPAYIILKPSLLGGISASEKWTQLAESKGIPWWATSALESNIGLNAIAQWAYKTGNSMPQGLGTGQLYTNNISSPLEIRQGELYYNPALSWDFNPLKV